MTLIRSTRHMSALARRLQQQGQRVGVVPTMGALHEGHLSLIREAVSKNDTTIVTIFVNPLQFGPNEDVRRYPRTMTADLRLARAAGAHIVFAPTLHALYPKEFQTFVDVGALGRRWEGESRPGHFRGVATVVAILFQLIRPTNVYFGQKDYQQCLIIRRLAQDLQLPLRVHMLPIVREPDGLAMSSRNRYLSQTQRRQATVLHQALTLARERIEGGERRAEPLIDAMRQHLSAASESRIDYVAIVDARTLEPVWRLRKRVAVLLAAWIGRTRLIDNLLVDVS